MRLTPKQLLAQKVLSHHQAIRVNKITLMYTPLPNPSLDLKTPVIIVSISKKNVPKATRRNYIKRVLRAILRQHVHSAMLKSHIWMWLAKESDLTKSLREQLVDSLKALST